VVHGDGPRANDRAKQGIADARRYMPDSHRHPAWMAAVRGRPLVGEPDHPMYPFVPSSECRHITPRWTAGLSRFTLGRGAPAACPSVQ
jgi:hypothetical protein